MQGTLQPMAGIHHPSLLLLPALLWEAVAGYVAAWELSFGSDPKPGEVT